MPYIVTAKAWRGYKRGDVCRETEGGAVRAALHFNQIKEVSEEQADDVEARLADVEEEAAKERERAVVGGPTAEEIEAQKNALKVLRTNATKAKKAADAAPQDAKLKDEFEKLQAAVVEAEAELEKASS